MISVVWVDFVDGAASELGTSVPAAVQALKEDALDHEDFESCRSGELLRSTCQAVEDSEDMCLNYVLSSLRLLPASSLYSWYQSAALIVAEDDDTVWPARDLPSRIALTATVVWPEGSCMDIVCQTSADNAAFTWSDTSTILQGYVYRISEYLRGVSPVVCRDQLALPMCAEAIDKLFASARAAVDNLPAGSRASYNTVLKRLERLVLSWSGSEMTFQFHRCVEYTTLICY